MFKLITLYQNVPLNCMCVHLLQQHHLQWIQTFNWWNLQWK